MRALAALLAVAIGCGGAAPAEPASREAPAKTGDSWPWDDVYSEPPEYGPREISAEAGRDYFMRTGVGDPYDGSRPGYGVGGHEFLSDLPPTDRRDVIEYLKLL